MVLFFEQAYLGPEVKFNAVSFNLLVFRYIYTTNAFTI